jgi:hypothetical protein
MSEIGFFITHCESCGGGIEFPANGVGEQIPCPHCQQLVTLKFPADSESNPTNQLGQFLAASEFPNSREELRLLSKFISPNEIGNPSRLEYWKTILNNPLEVIDRFLNEGFLQEANLDLTELLQCTKSSAELKALAKERGVAHSGTKQTVSERLVKADSEGISQLFRGKTFLKCSMKARILVDEWNESEKYAESQAEKACFEALKQKRFEEATLLVRKYNSTGGLPEQAKSSEIDDSAKLKHTWIVTAAGELPKGTDIGIYRAEEAKAESIGFLTLIFTTKLLRHAHFDENTMQAVQLSASMMFLWGTNEPPRWLRDDASSGQCDLILEARMLLSAVYHITRLREIKQAGIGRVQILSSNGPDDCTVCCSDNKKTYPIDSCPILPHENCTCEMGCMCIATASE